MNMSRLTRLFALTSLFAAVLACGGTEEEMSDESFEVDDFETAYVEGKEDAARNGRFEVFQGRDGRYYFHLLARNGQKLLRSGDYASSRGASDGAAVVRENAPKDERVALRQSADGQWYFVVTGGNGANVAFSELYTTKSSAEQAIAAVQLTVKSATNVSARSTGAKFQVFKGLDGQYYFHLRARNGEILLQSEAYTRRASAVSGTESVSTNGVVASMYQLRDGREGRAFFVLRAANGQVVARSEVHSSRAAAERARDAAVALLRGGVATP
jgi:uncharacterized protein YegP (UPF0339 family)